jgi:hypothetical protein
MRDAFTQYPVIMPFAKYEGGAVQVTVTEDDVKATADVMIGATAGSASAVRPMLLLEA